jgi:hypothetical protein
MTIKDDPEVEQLHLEFEQLFADVPPINKLGFFMDSFLDLHPPFSEAADKLNELLHTLDNYLDEDGYNWRMIAGMVDEAGQRLAWVERKERERGTYVDVHYYLRTRDERGLGVRWEIETYNPYFGCWPEFLQWMGNSVVIIYEEKHDIFIASVERDCPVRRVEITRSWNVIENLLEYRLESTGEVVRLRLPSLEKETN